MDNLTHSLVGALIGQAGLKRKTGLAMPALIIGANIPDIDAACFFWLDGVEHLAFRRGITHGPPAWLLLPLILAGLLTGWDRWQAKRGKRPEARVPVRFGWLYALAFIGCLSHPALDWMNTYGIRLLEPFSSKWFYGDVLFIIDIWLWLGMGIALWLSLRWEKRSGEGQHRDWRMPARTALAGVLAYIGMNAAITHFAEAGAEAGAGPVSGTQGSVTIASLVPLYSWDREIITGANGRYRIDGEAIGQFDLSEGDLADIAAAVPEARPFLFWSRTPFIEYRDGQYLLGDARYYNAMSAGQFTVVLPERACRDLADE